MDSRVHAWVDEWIHDSMHGWVNGFTSACMGG